MTSLWQPARRPASRSVSSGTNIPLLSVLFLLSLRKGWNSVYFKGWNRLYFLRWRTDAASAFVKFVRPEPPKHRSRRLSGQRFQPSCVPSRIAEVVEVQREI